MCLQPARRSMKIVSTGLQTRAGRYLNEQGAFRTALEQPSSQIYWQLAGIIFLKPKIDNAALRFYIKKALKSALIVHVIKYGA